MTACKLVIPLDLHFIGCNGIPLRLVMALGLFVFVKKMYRLNLTEQTID